MQPPFYSEFRLGWPDMYVRMYVYAHRLEPLIDASTCVFLCGGVSAYRLVLLPRILTVFPSTFCLLLHSFSIIPSRPPPPLGPSSTGSSTFPHCQTELPWDASNVTYTQVLAHAATEPIHLWGSISEERMHISLGEEGGWQMHLKGTVGANYFVSFINYS